eukprot:s788_g6.t1
MDMNTKTVKDLRFDPVTVVLQIEEDPEIWTTYRKSVPPNLANADVNKDALFPRGYRSFLLRFLSVQNIDFIPKDMTRLFDRQKKEYLKKLLQRGRFLDDIPMSRKRLYSDVPQISPKESNAFLVIDEEKLQTKGLLYLIQIVGNFNHGSWQSGDKKLSKAEALKEYLQTKDMGYFESLSESIAFDRQLTNMIGGTERCAAYMADFLATKSIRNRTEFANEEADPEIGHGATVEAHDEDQDADDAPGEDEGQPTTKKELYAIYAGKGPAAMVHDFLADHILKSQIIIIYTAAAPLENLYAQSLEQMKSRDGQMRFAAQRAWTMQMPAALQCMTQFHNDSLLMRLGFAPPIVADVVPPLEPPVYEVGTPSHVEQVLLKTIFDFGMTLGMELLWSHAHFHWTFPQVLAVHLLPNRKDRAAALAHVEAIAKAIHAAETVEGPKAELQACLQDASFNSEPLARLLMMKAMQGDETQNELETFAVKMWTGTGSTKELLESCFNNCNRQIGFMTTAKIASSPLKWVLSTLNPFCNAANVRQILPMESDWWQGLQSSVGQKAVQHELNHWFDPNGTELPHIHVSECAAARQMKQGEDDPALTATAILKNLSFKPAGADALQRSSAAMAYLVAEYENGFENIQQCWAGVSAVLGCLLKEKEVYFQFPKKRKKPVWLHNFSISDDNCMFKFVPTRLLLRHELPSALAAGSALLQTGECGDLLRPAFWRGLTLYLPQVQAVHRELKLPELKRGQGSGARGAVVKRDIVKQILTHLFPNCSEEDLLWMLNFTAPENKPKATGSDDGKEKLSDSLQFMVSCLDAENCQEFKNLVKQAREELIDKAQQTGKHSADDLKKTLVSQLEEAKAKISRLEAELKRDVAPHATAPTPAPSAASGSRVGESHKKVTPQDFKSLFPFAGKLAGLSFKHDVAKQFVQVVFPRCLDLFPA